MKVAIIGSLGFIGKHLVNNWHLEKDELYTFNSKNIFNSQSTELNSDLLNCDLIIWAAGKVTPYSAELDKQVIKYDLANWTDILRAFSELKDRMEKRFVFLSSGGCTYTSALLPFFENDEALGTNQYGKMKLYQENLLTRNFPNSLIIRLSNVYGPGQLIGTGQGVIAEWVSAVGRGEKLKIYGNPNSFRDYLHVSDAVDAIERIAKNKVRGIVNVGSGEPTTLEQIKNCLLTTVGHKIDFDILEGRNIDRSGYYLSIKKLNDITDWKPTINLSDGIKELLHLNKNR
jgi:UDP-glucose 4-epimerase